MLKRYSWLKENIKSINDDELDDLMPSSAKHQQIEKLCGIFEKMDSIKKVLQLDENNMSDVWALFENYTEEFPEMESWLSADAEIIHNRDFEKAVAKIIDSKEALITFNEKKTVESLLRSSTTQAQGNSTDNLSFSQRLLKKTPLYVTLITTALRNTSSLREDAT